MIGSCAGASLWPTVARGIVTYENLGGFKLWEKKQKLIKKRGRF